MSAKEYREYADECMRSAKNSMLVKECRERRTLLSNLIPLLDLPDAASSNKTRFIR